MNLKTLSPKQALNKAYQRQKPFRKEFDNFKEMLLKLLDSLNPNESEEYNKKFVAEFFEKTFYSGNLVNTSGKIDLAVYLGKDAKSKVGVIGEVKAPSEKNDMPSKDNLNVKAMHQVILYYLRERIDEKNDDIKNIFITNGYEWFIFDAKLFENLFYKNNELVKRYKAWATDKKVSNNTDHFYKEIASDFLNELDTEIEFVHFDLREYGKVIKSKPGNETKLISLFKIFSKPFLLKEQFTNDSNSLDKSFYNELLYIIGLEEVKEGSKKLIRRKNEEKREPGAIIENTIEKLKSKDTVTYFNDGGKFGENDEEKLFNIALQLNITWINRILFLKLLEAQLVNYHNGNTDYKFLDTKVIEEYDDLDELFHEVLARKLDERSTNVKEKFKKIPYLNSSLFERSELERNTISIDSLKDRFKIAVHPLTVLKDEKDNRFKGELSTLKYLLKFLDAYDFSTESTGEEIQEEGKSLINASVLGLIFEKINGYKEGSFFTPGFITMYMSRETLRRAVVQKFNDALKSSYKNFEELKVEIDRTKEGREKANEIINTLKVCDPAVGSGHFLVSVLNEIITIKSELGVLCYRDGSRVQNYSVEIQNDELIITDVETEDIFKYHINQKGNVIDELQKLQETIFHEKQTIIENCLFGVDINPNSVNICRLRLWIELLKNAYYTKETNYKELETLPNIDINIKQGNSLISRFKIDNKGASHLHGVYQKIKLATEKYKEQVLLYKSTTDKDVKREVEKRINEIKKQFEDIVNPSDKEVLQLRELEDQLLEGRLIFYSKEDKEEWQSEKNKLASEYKILKKSYEKKLRTIYSNAFEWRFEFPEVLDENGNYLGFDVVITNPPYLYNRDIPKLFREHYKKVYNTTDDLYAYFMLRAFDLLSINNLAAFITPNTFLTLSTKEYLRRFILNKSIDRIVYSGYVFDDAYVETVISFLQNTNRSDKIDFVLELKDYNNYDQISIGQEVFKNNYLARFFYPTKTNHGIWSKYYNSLKPLFKTFPKTLAGRDHKKEKEKLEEHIKHLKPGDVTLLGLIANGDQGLVTGNNSKYLARIIRNQDEELSILSRLLDNINQYRTVTIDRSKLIQSKETLYSIAEELKEANNNPSLFGKFFLYKTVYEKDINKKKKGEKVHWVKYFRGNTEGYKWYVPYTECINWTDESIFELEEGEITNSRWQGTNYFNSTGFAWVDYFTDRIKAFFVEKGPYSKNIVKLHCNSIISDKFAVGLLNSKFITYYVKNFITTTHTLQINDGRLIPIVVPRSKDITKMENLIDQILTSKKENPEADTSALEREIDELVYKLYGLTEEEIRVVEEV